MLAFAGIEPLFVAERLALVISNQAYRPDVGRLSRTHEDARLVAAAILRRP